MHLFVRMMYPEAQILLHMCAYYLLSEKKYCFHGNLNKAQVRMSSTWESESFLCLTQYISTMQFSLPCSFSFLSSDWLQYGICREGLFLTIGTVPCTRREGIQRNS